MSELKNCPFCGGTNIAAFDMFEYDVAVVGCRDCSAQVRAPKCDAVYSVKLWNTRTATPRFTEVEREAMETLVSFTGSAQKWMNVQNLNRSLSAIATVRSMLTASEIADKGKG